MVSLKELIFSFPLDELSGVRLAFSIAPEAKFKIHDKYKNNQKLIINK
jgi:hypothetical protein